MNPHRRDFLKLTTTATMAKPLGRNLRLGFVGVGVKGSAHAGNFLNMDNVDFASVCDVVPEQCAETQRQAERLGKKPPVAYDRGDLDFVRMCETEELDLVYTATPWRWHTQVCVAAMQNGKHAATEVPAAVTLDECWQLVEAAEKSGRHCCMMENVNYMANELAVFRMVRDNLFGELVHAEAGYLHDTRWLKVTDHGDGLWLGDHHHLRNGNLYPTHGLGPLAWYLDLNRGDRLDYLVSMSSNARGMDLYASEHLPEGHPKRERKYINGDVNSALIKTANGRSIILKHDTDLPRPYSRTNLVQGTRGIFRGYPDAKISLEKPDDHRHGWQDAAETLTKYKHPLTKLIEEGKLGVPTKNFPRGPIGKNAVWNYHPEGEARNGDFLEDYRLVQAIHNGTPPDFDVYDAASWSVVSHLTETSVANRSQAVDFPDFTRGKWKTNKPVNIVIYPPPKPKPEYGDWIRNPVPEPITPKANPPLTFPRPGGAPESSRW